MGIKYARIAIQENPCDPPIIHSFPLPSGSLPCNLGAYFYCNGLSEQMKDIHKVFHFWNQARYSGEKKARETARIHG
jgi:hypothetical protein